MNLGADPLAFRPTDMLLTRTGVRFFAACVVIVLVGTYLASAALDLQLVFFHLLFGAALFGLGLFRLELAFLVVPIALMNPYSLEETGTRLLISEYVLLIVFAAWLVQMLPLRGWHEYPKQFLIPAVLIVGSAMLSLAAARYVGAGLLQVIRYVEILGVFFFVVIHTCRSATQIRRMMYAILIGGICASAIGISQFIRELSPAGDVRRAYGWLGGGYGAAAATTFLTALGMLLYDRRSRTALLALFGLGISGVALIASQTRSWIGGVALALLLVFFRYRCWSPARVALILGGGVVGVFILLQTRFFGLIDYDIVTRVLQSAFRFGLRPGEYAPVDLSLLMRLNVWYFALQQFFTSPFIGMGVGNLRFSNYLTVRLAPPGPEAGYVDNQYLQFFVEAGVIAGVAWIVYMYRALRVGARSLRNSGRSPLRFAAFGLYASLITLAVGSFFWVVTPDHQLFGLLTMEIALLVNIDRLQRGTEGNSL